MSKERAKRYNKGKIRFELIPVEALEKVAQVYTNGAHKYSIYEDSEGKEHLGKDITLEQAASMSMKYDGAHNWRLGQDWVESLASVKRHIARWEAGEDFDEEIGTPHLGNAVWGLLSVLTYYDTHPELDTRKPWYKKPFKKVYFDLDGVLASFEKHFLEYLGLPVDVHPTDWNDYRFRDNFHKIANDDNFWMTCPELVNPAEIDYPIAGYCTARPCSNEVIEKWLQDYGFPKAEIINVGSGGSKVEELKKRNADFMIDDSINNFIELQSNGINCYLMTRPHNKKYNVGHWRCNNMKEFLHKVKNAD